MEYTLVIAKPGAVQRGLVGSIIHRFEEKALELRAITMLIADAAQIRENYRANEDEPWFTDMVRYMTSGPIIPMAWQGPNAIESGRQIIGDKDPWESEAGSLRGRYAADPIRTVVHGSRDLVEAIREINLWFPALLGVEEPPAPIPEAKGTRIRGFAPAPLTLKSYTAMREL
jgi:nucleoside-diphosphate kinase